MYIGMAQDSYSNAGLGRGVAELIYIELGELDIRMGLAASELVSYHISRKRYGGTITNLRWS